MSPIVEAGFADAAAIAVIVFAVYFPRHRRRDLAVAFFGVNICVFAVASILSSSGVGVGLGLGLFGVLSIIRLRSIELSQVEVAYYFAVLSLGLLGGLSVVRLDVAAGLMAMIVAGLFIGDHPRLFGTHRHQVVVLDRAYTDERALRTELEARLGATIHGFHVTKLDLVNEMTWVDVRYAVTAPAGEAAAGAVTVASTT